MSKYKRAFLAPFLFAFLFIAACSPQASARQPIVKSTAKVLPQAAQPAAPTKVSQPVANNQPTAQPLGKPTIIQEQPAQAIATQVPPAEGGEGGVEAAFVAYSDAKQGFSIGHPGTWTQDKTFTNGVKFMGGDEVLTLEFAPLAAGTDAMSFAQNDEAVVAKLFTGYKKIGLAASTEVKNAIVLGIGASGTSIVTGKTYDARGDRYYMPLSDGRIAILTVVGPVSNYDREGVRDIALTFKLTK